MTRSTLLYCLAFFVGILGFYFTEIRSEIDFHRLASDSPEALAMRNRIARLTDATGSVPVDSSFKLPSYRELYFYRGFRLVHDPALPGRTVRASGPAEQIRHLQVTDNDGYISFDYDRPIRIASPLILRTNLNQNGHEQLSIESAATQDTITHGLSLQADGPIRAKLLQLEYVKLAGPVEADADYAILAGLTGYDHLRGGIDVLEIRDRPDRLPAVRSEIDHLGIGERKNFVAMGDDD